MSRIRVLRIIARMNVGGPAVQISGLMRHLNADQFDQQLVTGFCATDEADYLETQAPDVIATRISGLGRAVRLTDDLKTVPRLVSIIQAFQPDIIHTHTAKAGTLGRVAATGARTRARVVHTYHGHLLHGYFSTRKTQAVVQLERMLARRTDRLVAVGPRVRDDLLAARIGSPCQYAVIPPGLALGTLPTKSLARDALGLDPQAPVIGMVGRITNIKRPDRFLDSVQLLHRTHPEAVFIVAGSGDEEATLRDRVRQAGLPVKMLGWRSDIEQILAACDILVLTSDNEGTPLSLIQAAMAGLPVVATDVGSVKDVVSDRETGLLCPTSAPAITSALAELLDDPDLAHKLGQSAQAKAWQEYGVERLADDHARLYESLARG